MLTLPAAWSEAMNKSGIQPVWLIRLYLRHMSSGADGDFYFCSGDKTIQASDDTAQNSISTITNFGAKINPDTRALSVSDVTITFVDDGAIRELIQSYYFPGKKVEISIGTVELGALSDFQKLGTFYVEEITPDEGTIAIRCLDAGVFWKDRNVSGGWLGWHPCEVIEQILQAAGVDHSTYDHESLHVANLTRYQHFMVSRANTTGPATGGTPPENQIEHVPPKDYRFDKAGGMSAKQMIDELVELMGGTFAPDQSGVYHFKEYNDSPSIAATWTADDIGDFTQSVCFSNLLNEIAFCNENDGGVGYKFKFTAGDLNSKKFFGVQATDPIQNIRALEFESPWLNAFGELWSFVTAGMDSKIRWAHENGFCGTYVKNKEPLTGRSTQASSNPLIQGTGWTDNGQDFTISGLPTGHGITTTNQVTFEVGDIQSPSNTYAWRSMVNATPHSVATNSITIRNNTGKTDNATMVVYIRNVGPFINVQPDSPRSLSADRLGYHMLVTPSGIRHNQNFTDPEIASVNTSNYFFYDYSLQQLRDPRWVAAGTQPTHDFPYNFNISGSVQFTYAARGLFGTTQKTWPKYYERIAGDDGSKAIYHGAKVWDVTIQVEMFNRLISRYAFGAPAVSLTTNVTQYAVEIGDFVKFTDDRFIGQGSAGLPVSADQVFEVVGKELRITDDTPSIKWDLVWFKDDSVTKGVPFTPDRMYDPQNYQVKKANPDTYTIYDRTGGVVFDTGGQPVVSIADSFSPKEV